MRRPKKSTVKDVADRASVSVASVSRVIRGDPAVGPEVRRAVEEAIKAVNYEIKPASLEKLNRRKIGLVIPDITNPYFPHLIKGITNIANLQNVEIVLCNSDNDIEREKAHFERLMSDGAQGIIYIPFSATQNPYLKKLIEAKYPMVFLDREVNTHGTCSVASNNEEGAYQAISYLHSLGHRDIVFISGPEHLSTSITRKAGFLRGLAEFGIQHNPALDVSGNTTFDSSYQVTSDLLQQKVIFTAIFASDDMMAFGAWKALEARGLGVPEDISIIGYDDIPLASIMSLSTIAQPAYEIGRNASMLLIDLITRLREPPQKIILRDSLIIRKSCRKI
jgi:LacI family transcriptional regulator